MKKKWTLKIWAQQMEVGDDYQKKVQLVKSIWSKTKIVLKLVQFQLLKWKLITQKNKNVSKESKKNKSV